MDTVKVNYVGHVNTDDSGHSDVKVSYVGYVNTDDSGHSDVKVSYVGHVNTDDSGHNDVKVSYVGHVNKDDSGHSDVKVNYVGHVNTDDSGHNDDDLVTINVGGVRFDTLRQTLTREPDCHLADFRFLENYFRKSSCEYFFDRDPDMFKATLNYLRSGELHLPSNICGPAAKTELEFWGIAPNKIERCCYINYNEWNSTQDALKRLERDRKMSLIPHGAQIDAHGSCLSKWRPILWRVLNRSTSSVAAKVFGVNSLLFVVVSIFSFLAETTEPFVFYPDGTPVSVNTENMTNTTLSNTIFVPGSTPETHETIGEKMRIKHPALQIIDMICLTYFTLEYITRLFCAPRRLKYVVSMTSIIDGLAILPDFIEMIIYHIRPDLRADVQAVNYLTILRVIRILRIFRLLRHSAGLWLLVYTLRASFGELLLLVWFMGLGVLVFASLVYFVETRERFSSIPEGFWWALITMTSVGYGDMYPVSTLGKMVGSLCAMSGVLMIGFTVPTLVNNFMLYYRHIQFAMEVERLEKIENEAGDVMIDINTDIPNAKQQGMARGYDKTKLGKLRGILIYLWKIKIQRMGDMK